MKIFIHLFFLLIGTATCFGTSQYPDILIYEGKEQALFSTPLEDSFSPETPRPEWLQATSTACWRGYVATWEIKEKKLWLVRAIRMEGYIDDKKEWQRRESDITRKLFPSQTLPLRASWFSGVLRLPQGKELQYVHMGFGSVYEKDVFISFDKGAVLGQQVVDNRNRAKLSPSDLAWRELGRMTEAGGLKTLDPQADKALEKGDWLDEQEFYKSYENLQTTGKPFKIRGLYFSKGKLWSPSRNGGDGLSLELDLKEIKTPLPESGGAVEATLEMIKGKYELKTLELRPLPPGTAIQKQLSSN